MCLYEQERTDSFLEVKFFFWLLLCSTKFTVRHDNMHNTKPWNFLYVIYIIYIFQVFAEFHIWWKVLAHKVSSGISVVVMTTVTGLDFGYVYLSSQLSILFCFYCSPCTPVGFTSNLSKFPLLIFSATHVPNQFFILSSIYNHVSRQFALGVFLFVFSSYASQTFYFILFLLFKFSFLVHIRFLFF